jgi:hypothetical protein
MKDLLTKLLLLLLVLPATTGMAQTQRMHSKVGKSTRYLPGQDQLLLAKKEFASKPGITLPPAPKRTNPQHPTTSSITVQDLGSSVNPFTSIGDGRKYLSVNPDLNTVALFRRGGPTDFGGTTNKPGDKLFLDLNTKGGAPNAWQIPKALMFNNEAFPFNGSIVNAPRYPQGLLFNPTPSNTDTNQLIPMVITRVLDGSNQDWGGYGKGLRKLAAGSPLLQTLQSSGDVLHFRIESMISTPLAVFTIEPEEAISGTGTATTVAFTDKIIITRLKYNTITAAFDSTSTYLNLPNEEGDSATRIGNTSIAFGPDGLHGFAVITAYEKNSTRNFGLIPHVARTTDGGDTWSGLIPINFNKTNLDHGLIFAEKDALRDSLFIGNYVRFPDDTTIVRADSATQEFAHPVDYTMLTMDLSVDRNNTAHIFGTLYVAGFGDTLLMEGPTFFRPRNGGWNVDIMVRQNEDFGRGILISRNQTVQSCFGDCDVDANSFIELNRPQISRSKDGSMLALFHNETDLEAHPQFNEFTNSNPDLRVRYLRVESNGEVFLSEKTRNLTRNSDKDGLSICPVVAPLLLNSDSGGYEAATTMVLLSEFDTDPGVWPVTHNYISGIRIPAAIQVDSTPLITTPQLILRIRDKHSVLEKGAMQPSVQAYPNPAGNQVTLRFDNLQPGNTIVNIRNLNGQTVETLEFMASESTIYLPLKLIRMPKGLYLIEARNGNQRTTMKLNHD